LEVVYEASNSEEQEYLSKLVQELKAIGFCKSFSIAPVVTKMGKLKGTAN